MLKCLNPNDILTFAYQIANGMDYLASNDCVHRDLAARNILLGEEMVCKLSDFGLARDLAGETQYEMKSEGGRVPIRWMAPESVFYNVYTSQSDVWSFGILLWELVTLGSHPYPGMSARRLTAKIQNGYRLSKPPHCSNEMYSIMYECWHADPKQRPSFHELYENITKMLADAQNYLEMSDFDVSEYEYFTRTEVTGFTGATSGETCNSSDSNESTDPARYVVEPGNLLKPREAECSVVCEL
ncbi:tyrosine kinase receptor Cad96Ca-like [Amphiura filiformis]|uniref:tyrosine kinase receptor Cad96Ca-like n=1 Tax=Amphiura filiformis TaxID=82378 RepID=UPI003B220E92